MTICSGVRQVAVNHHQSASVVLRRGRTSFRLPVSHRERTNDDCHGGGRARRLSYQGLLSSLAHVNSENTSNEHNQFRFLLQQNVVYITLYSYLLVFVFILLLYFL